MTVDQVAAEMVGVLDGIALTRAPSGWRNPLVRSHNLCRPVALGPAHIAHPEGVSTFE
jgi:hypothetical protein